MEDPRVERIRRECAANQKYQNEHAEDKTARLLERRQWRISEQNEAINNGDLAHESLDYPTYEDI